MLSILIDLRADKRYIVNVGGILEVEGLPQDTYDVTVRDVSRSGLRVSSPISIPAGTRVAVTSGQTNIVGEVRYARAVGVKEFWLGIKVDLSPSGGIDLAAFFAQNLSL
jgi:hypothetical protein